MRRGEVYEARLDPVEGSEQGGTRPVIIVTGVTQLAMSLRMKRKRMKQSQML